MLFVDLIPLRTVLNLIDTPCYFPYEWMNKGALWDRGGIIILSAKSKLQKTLTYGQNVPVILWEKLFFILVAPQKFHPQAVKSLTSSSDGNLTSNFANFNIEKLYKMLFYIDFLMTNMRHVSHIYSKHKTTLLIRLCLVGILCVGGAGVKRWQR